MVTKELEFTEKVTKTESYDICDKCGLEIDEKHELIDVNQFWDSRNKMLEKYEYPVHTHRTIEYYITERMIKDIWVEITYSIDKIEICEDCYNEMFGWIE